MYLGAGYIIAQLSPAGGSVQLLAGTVDQFLAGDEVAGRKAKGADVGTRFQQVLDRFFDGEPDRATDERLFTATPTGEVRSSEP